MRRGREAAAFAGEPHPASDRESSAPSSLAQRASAWPASCSSAGLGCSAKRDTPSPIFSESVAGLDVGAPRHVPRCAHWPGQERRPRIFGRDHERPRPGRPRIPTGADHLGRGQETGRGSEGLRAAGSRRPAGAAADAELRDRSGPRGPRLPAGNADATDGGIDTVRPRYRRSRRSSASFSRNCPSSACKTWLNRRRGLSRPWIASSSTPTRCSIPWPATPTTPCSRRPRHFAPETTRSLT